MKFRIFIIFLFSFVFINNVSAMVEDLEDKKPYGVSRVESMFKSAGNAVADEAPSFLSSVRSGFKLVYTGTKTILKSTFALDQKPSYPKAVAKIALGALGVSILAEESSYVGQAGWVACGDVCFKGLSELCYLLYHQVYDPDLKRKVFKADSFPTREEKKKYNTILVHTDSQLSCIVRGGARLINFISASFAALKHLQSVSMIIRLMEDPLALTFSSPLICEKEVFYFCTPIIIPSLSVGFAALAIYNMKELWHVRSPHRGNVPLCEMANGMSAIILSTLTLHMFTTPDSNSIGIAFLRELGIIPKRSPDRLTQLIYGVVRAGGHAQFYKGLGLMVKNVRSWVWKRPAIEDINIRKEKSTIARKEKHESAQTPKKSKPRKEGVGEQRTAFQVSVSSSTFRKSLLLLRKKAKTRGLAYTSKAASPAPSNGSSPQFFTVYSAQQREEGLKRLAELKKRHPIKAKKIEKELYNVAAFLHGKIEPIDGSEFRLVWEVNGKKFAIKFEKAHGKNGKIYKGKKLKNILGMCETGYLVGLEEEEIHNYMEQYNLDDLWRLPRFPFYVLLNRTE